MTGWRPTRLVGGHHAHQPDQSRDNEHCDEGENEECGHGSNHALMDIPPRVADLTLLLDILPTL